MRSGGDIRLSFGSFLQNLRQDARFAFRVFTSSPGFTLVAVLTLGLGIAVCSTVFSWIDGVLLHSYPGVTDTRGLALVETNTSSGASSYLDYRDYRDGLKRLGEVAIGRITPLSVGADGNAERAWAELVSANYFDVLRVKPVLGRAFLPEEGADKPGAFPVAVISHRMWQSRYHGDPGVLGTTIRLNRHLLTIVGVAPPRFRGSLVGFVYDVWMPITMAAEMGTGDGPLHLPRVPRPHLDPRPAGAGRHDRAGACRGRLPSRRGWRPPTRTRTAGWRRPWCRCGPASWARRAC